MLVPQQQTLFAWTEQVKRIPDEGRSMRLEDWSWSVDYYENPVNLRDKSPNQLAYTFPSINAAKRYMDDCFPDVWYYDIILTKQRVECPHPYSLIL